MEHTQWQSLLKLGNECFSDKQWDQAEHFYSEAYNLLALDYINHPLSADILIAWICSCHNLSSLYEANDQLELSLKFLKVPHDYLMEVSKSEIQNEDIKLIAFKGISLTLPPILAFAKKHPICGDCKSKLGAISRLIEEEHHACH